MILVVLAVVWVVALTPLVLRKISERQLTSGVRSYHRRLSRLSSTFGYSGAGGSAERVSGSVPGAMIGFSAAALRLHHERHGAPVEPPVSGGPARTTPDDVLPGTGVSASALTASPATAARRRQVVSVLVGTTVLCLLIGIIPGARMFWDVALLTLACTVAYAALLIHFHRMSVERAQKVIAIETRRHASAALENRRQVMTVGARYAAGGGSDGCDSGDYASSTSPLSGSGWSVTSVRT
jgi:hypothetical protein